MYSDDENAILLQLEMEEDLLDLLFHVVTDYQTGSAEETEAVQILGMRLGKAYFLRQKLELSIKDAVTLIGVLFNSCNEQVMLIGEMSELISEQKKAICRLEETVATQRATIRRMKGMFENE